MIPVLVISSGKVLSTISFHCMNRSGDKISEPGQALLQRMPVLVLNTLLMRFLQEWCPLVRRLSFPI